VKRTPAAAVVALSLLLVPAGCGSSAASPTAGPNASLTAQAAGTSDPSAPSGLTTHGVGHVSGTPDVVTITIGVQNTAPHAGDALSANAAKANAVIASLKSHGVATADIQTSQLSLYPQYDNGSANTIGGYQVTNSVTAKLHAVAKAGEAIDAAVTGAGDAGRLQGVSFSFDDDSGLLVRARADAVAAAKTQAQQLADASGAKLGTLRSLSEDSRSSAVPYAPAAGVADRAATPVQSGSQELTISVTAVWNLA
jgi:uncharacterized protein YggE